MKTLSIKITDHKGYNMWHGLHLRQNVWHINTCDLLWPHAESITKVKIKTICMSASFDHIPFSMICTNHTKNQNSSIEHLLKPDRLFPGSQNIKSRFVPPWETLTFSHTLLNSLCNPNCLKRGQILVSVPWSSLKSWIITNPNLISFQKCCQIKNNCRLYIQITSISMRYNLYLKTGKKA